MTYTLVSILVFGTTLSHILSLFNSHNPKRSFGKEAAEKKKPHFVGVGENLNLVEVMLKVIEVLF